MDVWSKERVTFDAAAQSYGTYELDNRFPDVPEGFLKELLSWAIKFVKQATDREMSVPHWPLTRHLRRNGNTLTRSRRATVLPFHNPTINIACTTDNRQKAVRSRASYAKDGRRPAPNIESPDYWRLRAEEARTLSEQMRDTQTKVLMLGIAETYERIAKAYETSVLIAGDQKPR